MNIEGRVIAVTGAGSGIGRALCHALAKQNPKGLAVMDIDSAAAQQVAHEVGGRAYTVDVANEEQVKASIAEAETALGPIDIYCANAAVADIGGVELDNAIWQRTWDINVMGHVYAARALLPKMLERGEGYLVYTASAAGLLVNMGTAPYTATKHAVVGLAEWLAITHANQGLKVSCVCPQFVNTPMVHNFDLSEPMRAFVHEGILEPEAVADDIVQGIEREEFLILPHPHVAEFVQAKAQNHEKWLSKMARLNAKLEA